MSRAAYVPASALSKAAALFPISMVLFEFSTYIANDMVLPAMPTVVREFGAGEKWVPTGMSAYLAGGGALQWFLGPLSDRVGRRPVMLWGAALFIASLLGVFLVDGIVSFAVLRFLQGFGLCFVVAAGYAAVQEAFTEATALRVTALMANVALIAPLLGPLAGALLITVAPWRWIFVVIAALSALALAGLWKTMPETVVPGQASMRPGHVARNYRLVFANARFLLGTAAMCFAGIPLMAWIGQSPVILIERAGLDPLTFGLWQLPVFASLIAGNLVLSRYAERVSPARLVAWGTVPLLAGVALGLGIFARPGAWGWLIVSTSVYAFGMGLVNAVFYRLALYASDVSKGTVSAALGMVLLATYSLGIEAAKMGHAAWGNPGFAAVCAAAGVFYYWTQRAFLRRGPAAS
jgi:DHA1 family multidrug/chloramphenicol efflux transport protein-like MFS transporter